MSVLAWSPFMPQCILAMALTFFGAIIVLTHPLALARAGDFRPLDPIDDTKVQPVPTFVAADVFKTGGRIGGRTLSSVGLNFAEHFVRVVEQNVPSASLKVWTLRYTIGDRPLIEALGGEEHADLHSLASIHRIMEMGDYGPSLTDGRSNFAYLKSPVDRKLWAVHWFVNDANEWIIGAVQVPHPQLDWQSASRLFGPAPGTPPDDFVSAR
jgi:hypothetical protein